MIEVVCTAWDEVKVSKMKAAAGEEKLGRRREARERLSGSVNVAWSRSVMGQRRESERAWAKRGWGGGRSSSTATGPTDTAVTTMRVRWRSD